MLDNVVPWCLGRTLALTFLALTLLALTLAFLALLVGREHGIDCVSAAFCGFEQSGVVKPALWHLADFLVDKMLVDNDVSSDIPLMRIPAHTPGVMFEHGMEHFMSDEEYKLVIVKGVDKVGVEIQRVIGSTSCLQLVRDLDFHTEGQCGHEWLVDNQPSTGFAYTVKCLLI